MNVLFTKGGLLIPPHLQHTLKSYYYNTDSPIFCIDENGSIMDAYPKQMEYMNKICMSHFDDIQQLIKNNLNCDAHTKKLTFTFTYKEFFHFLISPIFQDRSYKGALIAGPIYFSKESCNLARLNAAQSNDSLGKALVKEAILKEPPKSFYMSQLLHHLLEKSIYIGPNTSKSINIKEYLSEDDMKYRSSKLKPSEVISKIVTLILDKKPELALDLYKKTLMLGDFFLDKHEDNLNNLKGEIMTLCALISYELQKLGCDLNDIERIKSVFIHRILNTSNYQCLFNCGEEIIQSFYKLLIKTTFLGKTKPVKDTILYIQSNFKEKIQICKVCSNVFLSNSYLSALFKEETGMSIIEYLKTCRISNSKYLLLNSNLSILEIALESGFESQNYFSTVFKTIIGITPNQYRKAREMN